MKTNAKISIFVAGLFPVCGCVHLAESHITRPTAAALDKDILARFAPGGTFSTSAMERELSTNPRYSVVRFELRSASQFAESADAEFGAEARAGSDEAGPIEWLNPPSDSSA